MPCHCLAITFQTPKAFKSAVLLNAAHAPSSIWVCFSKGDRKHSFGLQGPVAPTVSAWGKGNTVQRLSQQQQGQQQPSQSSPGTANTDRAPSIPTSQVSSVQHCKAEMGTCQAALPYLHYEQLEYWQCTRSTVECLLGTMSIVKHFATLHVEQPCCGCCCSSQQSV